MLTETNKLIKLLRAHLHTGETTRSDFGPIQRIPLNKPLQYLPGVVATHLPSVVPGVEFLLMDMEAGSSTGRIVHNCKKRAVCMSGEFYDGLSNVVTEEGRTAIWQADTPHIITAKSKTRILLQFNR